MATYQLTLDRRTLFGKNMFNFLAGMNCIDESEPNIAIVDERTADGKRMIKILNALGAIKKNEQPDNDKIVNAVSKRFFEKRKRTGELTDNELFILNSQINASRLFADRL